MMNSEIITNAKNVLTQYMYDTTYVQKICDACEKAKNTPIWGGMSLTDILSKHPNWNDKKKYIVVEMEVVREVDKTTVNKFAHWITIHMPTSAYTYIDIDQMNFLITDIDNPNITSMTYKEVANDLYERHTDKTPFRMNQKKSRVISKLCTALGLSEICVPVEERFVDDSGNEHVKIKDHGFNYQFAAYCDAINPSKTKRKVVISINPVDYFTMSIGKFTSCMTIDRFNIRKMPSEYNILGAYSGGVESFMLDPYSLIMYCVDTHYTGQDMELQDKEKRCVFSISENQILQNRVYPDGRDNNGNKLSEEMRTVMQKVIADCVGVPNKWTIAFGEFGSSSIGSIGTHYRDYYHYDDTNVSILEDKTFRKMTIGAYTICPKCGVRHSNQNNILCNSCLDESFHSCSRCGKVTKNMIHIDNSYFCCEHCANEYEYFKTKNTNKYMSRYSTHAFFDDGDFYEIDYQTVQDVMTLNLYHDEDSAIMHGCSTENIERVK